MNLALSWVWCYVLHYRLFNSCHFFMLIRFLLLFLISLSVVSCANKPRIGKKFPQIKLPHQGAVDAARVDKRLLKQLKQRQEVSSPANEKFLLKMAADLLKKRRLSAVNQTLASIKKPLSSPILQTYYRVLVAHYAVLSQREKEAFTILRDIESSLASLPIDLQIYFRQLIGFLYQKDGQLLPSIKHRVALSELLGDKALLQNNLLLWKMISSVDLEYLPQANDMLSKGWFDLVKLHKDFPVDSKPYNMALRDWLQQFSAHPAQLSWPGPFAPADVIQQFTKFQHAAVFLPLSGKLAFAGKAALDGLLTAYYQQLPLFSIAPKLTIIDTNIVDIAEAYNGLAQSSVDLIIGPLQKKNARALNMLNVHQPVLLLNQINDPTPNLTFQFNVAPEEEVDNIISHASRQGLVRAMLISDNSVLGQRVANHFRGIWEEIGGVIIDTPIVDESQLAQVLQSSLHIDDSKARRRALARVLNTSLKFEPRRRQDIDFIVLATDVELARRVRPQLQFYYVSQLPIFASSHLYSDIPNPERDSDLNSIKFTAYPWMIGNHFVSMTQLKDDSVSKRRSYRSLFALGFDAFKLATHFEDMSNNSNFSFQGLTGQLSISDSRLIQREMYWAQFKAGKVVPYVVAEIEAADIETPFFTP